MYTAAQKKNEPKGETRRAGPPSKSTPRPGAERDGAVQRIRIVRPRDITYYKGWFTQDMFGTHKIVHYPGGGAPGPLPAERHGSYGKDASAANTGIDPAAFQSLMDSAAGQAGTPYFREAGKLSAPQLAAGGIPNPLGTDRYQVSGAAPNSATAGSGFTVQDVSTNAKVPMLVSDGGNVALNALYPEPKEVYMSPEACAQTNERMNVWGGYPDPLLEEPAEYKMKLIKSSNAVRVNTKWLYQCTPLFSKKTGGDARHQRQETIPNPDTNACDETVKKFYHNPANPMNDASNAPRRYLSASFTEAEHMPWQFHVAGILYKDARDVLSLENGARTSFLKQRGAVQGPLDVSQAAINAREPQLNKTWYFRLYGNVQNKDAKQNIRAQSVSRFSG